MNTLLENLPLILAVIAIIGFNWQTTSSLKKDVKEDIAKLDGKVDALDKRITTVKEELTEKITSVATDVAFIKGRLNIVIEKEKENQEE